MVAVDVTATMTQDGDLTVADAVTQTTLAAIETLLGGTLAVDTDVTALATEAKLEAVRLLLAGTLAVDTGLTIPTPQTDAVTRAELDAAPVSTKHATADGTWGYHAGTSGTPTITGRVVGITATGGTSAASFTINGGDTITVPADMSIEVTPRGNLSAPTIVFTGTASYFVEVVS